MKEEQIYSVDVSRTRQDYFLFSAYLYKSVRDARLYFIIGVFTILITFMLLINLFVQKRVIPSWMLTNELTFCVVCGLLMFIAITLWRICMLPLLRRDYLNENQMFLRPHNVMINERGLRETSPVSESFVMWQGVDKIEKTPDLFMVFTDRLQAYTIPVRNFATPQLADQFYENMLGYWRKANERVSS